MKIGVCIKQVPDTATKIGVKEDHSGILEDNTKYIVSPYDEYALEEALRTKEKIGNSEVIVLSVGQKRTAEALRNALAMGCDKAIHINTEGQGFLDSHAIAKLLATKIQSESIVLVFTGRHAVDDDNCQVSQMLAEFLKCPHVTMVSKFALEGSKAKVERDVEGGAKEIWEVELPAVFAATKGLNEPRYASLKGIMQAKSKSLSDIPVTQTFAQDLTPKVLWSNYQMPAERKVGKIFKDEPAKAVKEVVRLLREEAKVI